MMKRFAMSLALLGSITVINSFAADHVASPKAVALINKVTHDQLSILTTFPGPANLEGFVLKPADGQPVIMYADQQGRYVVYGTIISDEGKNLSELNNDQYVKKYIAQNIVDNLAEVTTVKEGSDLAPYKMMVLADPNCSACHYAYNVLKPSIDKGDLQVEWIFVYFVRPDSQAKAAAIMTAKDPGKAMAENEAGFDMKTEEGGIAPMKDIPKNIVDKLEGNMDFMHRSGITGTPTIMYWSHGEFKYMTGIPSDLGTFLKDNAPQVKQVN